MIGIERHGDDARVHASSILEYADLCERHPFRTSIFASSWRGAESHNEALRLAREGSPAHRELMTRGLSAARPFTAKLAKPARRMDVCGEVPHPARAAAGDPASMIRRARRDVSVRPVSRWLVHMGARVDVEAQQRVNRGAAILALLDTIEASGVRVEVELVMRASGVPEVKGHWETIVMMKRAEEPLDLDVAAFALVCPAIHRWLDFGLRNGASGQSTSQVGGTRDVERSEALRDGRVYFPACDESATWNAPDTAARTILTIYERESGHKLESLT
jgi:hypothetical protein